MERARCAVLFAARPRQNVRDCSRLRDFSFATRCIRCLPRVQSWIAPSGLGLSKKNQSSPPNSRPLARAAFLCLRTQAAGARRRPAPPQPPAKRKFTILLPRCDEIMCIAQIFLDSCLKWPGNADLNYKDTLESGAVYASQGRYAVAFADLPSAVSALRPPDGGDGRYPREVSEWRRFERSRRCNPWLRAVRNDPHSHGTPPFGGRLRHRPAGVKPAPRRLRVSACAGIVDRAQDGAAAVAAFPMRFPPIILYIRPRTSVMRRDGAKNITLATIRR